MAPSLNSLIRKRTAVSWQSPAVQAVLPAVDLLDQIAGRRGGLQPLPRFSERIRSNGVWGQFGGRRFVADGEADLAALISHGLVSEESDVLDIGCGVGRLATAFARRMLPRSFHGVDVDRPSIDACRRNPLLDERFRFTHVDIQTDLYNPGGSGDSIADTLPVESDSADLIVAMSLFTHLFADECEHYAHEMLRALRPGGAIVVTAFVLNEDGHEMFPHHERGSHVLTPVMPRKAIAQRDHEFALWFGETPEILPGTWGEPNESIAPRGQDWVVVRRAASLRY